MVPLQQLPARSKVELAFVPFILITLLLDSCAASFHHVNHVARNYPDWTPNAIVDIGANLGTWSTHVREVFPHAKMMLFEASPLHNETLKKVVSNIGNAHFHISLLSDKAGDIVPFYQADTTHTGNSMFKENTKYFKDVRPVERITSTLDKEIEASFLAVDHIDYLKLDVQGAELAILRGAKEVLKRVTFVQLETSVIEYNAGGVCFHEVDEFMRQKGFYLYDFGDLVVNSKLFKTKGTGQFDTLYVRPTSDRAPGYFEKAKPKYCGHIDSSSKGGDLFHVSQLKINNNEDSVCMSEKTTVAFVQGALLGFFISKARLKVRKIFL